MSPCWIGGNTGEQLLLQLLLLLLLQLLLLLLLHSYALAANRTC
jgi:hypothetical protein